MPTSVELVLPVLNEERDLWPSTVKLHEYLAASLSHYDWRILIADNGSTDSTLEAAEELSREYERVGYIRLQERGRGRAVRKAWLDSDADILGYMDIDLSTELAAVVRIVEAVDGEGYDIAIGSRLANGATVIGRPPHREFISRAYSLTFRTMFLSGIKDAQCGFKAIRRTAARELLPLVVDQGWFFDTELLLIAEKSGYRIKEVPVLWTDDPDSRVKIVRTAVEDLKGLIRLRVGGLRGAARELARK
jgi:glycosyltransferase involved in cell wall biosynthesis